MEDGGLRIEGRRDLLSSILDPRFSILDSRFDLCVYHLGDTPPIRCADI